MLPAGASIATRATLLAAIGMLSMFGRCASGSDESLGDRANGSPDTPSFERQIVPLLSRLGCNDAACHGSATGRGGFGLSLFGARPRDDYDTIVFGEAGRRLRWDAPRESLLLTKPATIVDHEGDQRLEIDDRSWRTIERWIAAGAPYGPAESIERLEVTPSRIVAEPGATNVSGRIVVTAIEADGTRRDLTENAMIEPADPGSVRIESDGRLSSEVRGESLVFVHHAGRYAVVRLVLPFERRDALRIRSETPLDEPIDRQLEQLGIVAAPTAAPSTLLRRASLDLAGRLPTIDETLEFERDRRPDAWSRRLDRLIASPEFDRVWTWRTVRWLDADTAGEPASIAAYRVWLGERIATDRDWNKTAALLLRARGDSHREGATGWWRSTGDPRVQSERFAEQLLGTRLRCANCHDHPLDRWTQDDYHGLAAIFAMVGQGRIVQDRPSGTVQHPRTSVDAVPRIPGRTGEGSESADPERLAAALVDDAELARRIRDVQVNRVWESLLGRGIVHPIDDWRESNPPSHPELLGRLREDHERDGGSLRRLVRRIALSAAYRRASTAARDETSDDATDIVAARWFGRTARRELPAELLFDAIVQVTEVGAIERPGSPSVAGAMMANSRGESNDPAQRAASNPSDIGIAARSPLFPDEPAAERAIDLQRRGSTDPSLGVLGRCAPGETCGPSPTAAAPRDLRQGLHWINGSLVLDRLADPNSSLQRSFAAAESLEAWTRRDDSPSPSGLDRWYLAIEGRRPSEAERGYWTRELAGASDERERIERLIDLAWATVAAESFRSRP